MGVSTEERVWRHHASQPVASLTKRVLAALTILRFDDLEPWPPTLHSTRRVWSALLAPLDCFLA